MRIAADGFIDISDGRRVRTPGLHNEDDVEPMPEPEAVAFLLSHSFKGHRRMVRGLTLDERRRIRRATWAGSIADRMNTVDRVWRSVTEPVSPLRNEDKPKLVQVVQLGSWAWPLHIDGSVTRVIPEGGMPTSQLKRSRKSVFRLDRKTA
ncbi:MAG: hypothetical protein P8170_21025 [Gemmatimonadota bacterium]|jgi:hypothetical protein